MADDSPISVADVPKEDEQSDQSDQNDQNGDEASEKTSVSSEPGSDHESNADAKEDVDEEDEAKEGSPSPSPSPEKSEKPKIKKRKSSGRRKKSSSTSVSRPRSRKSRSRSARARPSTSNRHLTICWYGRKCNRAECWFKHPDGRECDERKGNGKGGKGEPCNFRRRRSSSAHRRRERSASRQRYRSPQKSRRRVAASRSASTKPPRPRRGRKAVEKECKDESNPEGKQEGQIKEVKKNPLKKVNFREFMMNHCEDGASPEDAIVAFKVYCEDLAKKELDILKNTGLFFDLYHPMAQLRFYDWQRQMAQIRSHNFAHDLNANKYHSLSLRARRPVMPSANVPMAPTCPVAGHLKAPEFAFDANVGALMISGLPVAVSTWDVVEAMQDFPGFITAAWTPPSSEKELSRTFYASFTDAKAARAALFGLSEQADLLSNKGLTAGVARASLLEASVDLSALVLPPEMSTPERLKKDLELSAKVIRKMDEHFGISSDGTSALLSHQLDTEKQLDIQILYLRRVHHFCFYSGKWCKDEWTLRDCCGAAALRETPSASGDDGPSVWGVGHEKRIHDFLQQAMDKEIVGRPVVLHHQEPKVLERFQRAANEKILKVHDQKFQCQACNKFFKGPEYVFKHLHRIHTNILDDVREELHQEIARSAFRADPAHPPAHAMTA